MILTKKKPQKKTQTFFYETTSPHNSNNIIPAIPLIHRRAILIQRLEPTALALEKLIRLAVLDELALLHDDHLVEVKDGVELVGDGDDGVGGEAGAEHFLDVCVGGGVEAMVGK